MQAKAQRYSGRERPGARPEKSSDAEPGVERRENRTAVASLDHEAVGIHRHVHDGADRSQHEDDQPENDQVGRKGDRRNRGAVEKEREPHSSATSEARDDPTGERHREDSTQWRAEESEGDLGDRQSELVHQRRYARRPVPAHGSVGKEDVGDRDPRRTQTARRGLVVYRLAQEELPWKRVPVSG